MLHRFALGLLALAAPRLVVAQIPIVGVPTRGPVVPIRRNINDMEATGGPQWDLLLRALTEMQNADASDELSYFQVMGIHGKPYIEWNGAGEENTDGWQGYCPHGERIFASWHRPFIILYEQVLTSHARRLAGEYPEDVRGQYMQAAEDLRAPYWDWASDSMVPPITVPQTVQVNVPNGNTVEQIEIDNPFLTYWFPSEVLDGAYGEWDDEYRERMFRCPPPQSYPDSANELTSERPYRDWVYDLFTRSTTFMDFVSTGDTGISLEQIHNGLHWDAACEGQFLSSDFAAFDPIFMLHHANVDRLLAYWQAISPDESMFIDAYAGKDRFSTPWGTTITPDSPLQPFFQANGDFHTSMTVRNIHDFGYSYEGLEYGTKAASQVSEDTRRLINRLYGPGNAAQKRHIELRNGTFSNSTTATKLYASIELNVDGLDRPCAIELYVGDRKLGDFVVMELPRSGTVYGSFPIHEPQAILGAAGLSTDDMADSITSALELSIVKPNSTRISVSSAPGLKVEIEDVVVTESLMETMFPTFRESRRRPVMAAEKLMTSAVSAVG